MTQWEEANKWETEWWEDFTNTLFEDEKQIVYAQKMGIPMPGSRTTPYTFDAKGASVLDIGGGPNSILLKTVNFSKAKVVDPLPMPQWVIDRYKAHGVEFEQVKAEDLDEKGYDECWMYNVLQHVEEPEKIVKNVRRAGKLLRVFDWLETPISDGHIQSLKAEDMEKWLGGIGKVETLNTRPTVGKCFYGIFIGDGK